MSNCKETINCKKLDYSPYVIHLVSVYKICKYVNILQMLGNIVKCSTVRSELLIYSDVFSNGILCMLFRIEFVQKGFILSENLYCNTFFRGRM